MSEMVFPMPVSLEQVGAVIRRMTYQELQRLLELAPELRQVAQQPTARTEQQARETVARLREKLLAEADGEYISPNEPFLGGMTLGEYLALPDNEQAALWDTWGDIDLMKLEEGEVQPDALLA